MKYTSYEWRTDIITRSFKNAVFKTMYPKKMRKYVRSLKRAERNEFLQANALAMELDFRARSILAEPDDQKKAAMLSDTVITASQLTQEFAFTQGERESWYPETRHLLKVLSSVDMNAHAEELYHGEPITRLIHVPSGFKTDGEREVRSMLVTLATPRQKQELLQKFVDRYNLPDFLVQIQTKGEPDDPRIFITTCAHTDFFVADFELSRMDILLQGRVKDGELQCVTPYDFDGLIPQANLEDPGLTRQLCLDHFSLALRLMIYAQAFPEVLVDFEGRDVKGERAVRKKSLTTHERIRRDAGSIRYVTHRKGYHREAHTRVLRAARFRRNEDGTPRVVPVEACWVPPIGYIGSQKKTVKELEAAALEAASSARQAAG
ncbi:MAG: hypothetical protein ACYTG5_13430 [Planctomycetota bacterium]|jgi:hypothetical protein